MKTVNLSTEETKLVVTALNFVYSQKLKRLELNRNIMNEAEIDSLLTNANRYSDLQLKISKNNQIVKRIR